MSQNIKHTKKIESPLLFFALILILNSLLTGLVFVNLTKSMTNVLRLS